MTMTNKELGEFLANQAAFLPEEAPDDSPKFSISPWPGFTVRCENTREALLSVAAKFKKDKGPKGKRKDLHKKLSYRQAYSSATFDAMVGAGEFENAVHYASAAGKPVYFTYTTRGRPWVPLAKVAPVGPPGLGLIVALVQFDNAARWQILHGPSGMRAGNVGGLGLIGKRHVLETLTPEAIEKIREALDAIIANDPDILTKRERTQREILNNE